MAIRMGYQPMRAPIPPRTRNPKSYKEDSIKNSFNNSLGIRSFVENVLGEEMEDRPTPPKRQVQIISASTHNLLVQEIKRMDRSWELSSVMRDGNKLVAYMEKKERKISKKLIFKS